MKITGDTPKIKRIQLGLYSFDRAFENARGETGFPLGQVTEIAGPTFCGKSTLVYGLSGLISHQLNTNVILADFEGFDPEFLTDVYNHTGFDGSVHIVQKDTDEKTLDALIDQMKKKEFNVSILDSVGAISPISEAEGALGDANMGRRAKLMAQFTRKIQHVLLSDPKTLFMINHVHPNLGGFGTTTPGGETMKYLSAIRIRVKRKEEFKDQSYVIEGKVTKNRYGYKDRVFYIVMLSGKGIHIGLSAMYDCFLLGLADRGKTVKMNGESLGFLKTFFDNAQEGNNDVFDPFIKALKDHHGVVRTDEGDSDEPEETSLEED